MKKIKELTNYLMIAPALAASDTISILPTGEDFGALGTITIPGIISAAIKLLLVVAALISFFFLIIGGIKWITSGGDKEGTANAQSTLTAALIGLAIVFASWAIIRLLETFFGIHILTGLAIPTIK
ncbi:MAG TPA: hypothetical protein VMY36_02900 [Patescibacteria group bacterium]|nr:hypothetical protein [Patescibacteria group bacterium]